MWSSWLKVFFWIVIRLLGHFEKSNQVQYTVKRFETRKYDKPKETKKILSYVWSNGVTPRRAIDINASMDMIRDKKRRPLSGNSAIQTFERCQPATIYKLNNFIKQTRLKMFLPMPIELYFIDFAKNVHKQIQNINTTNSSNLW